jgi:hypothetical protein
MQYLVGLRAVLGEDDWACAVPKVFGALYGLVGLTLQGRSQRNASLMAGAAVSRAIAAEAGRRTANDRSDREAGVLDGIVQTASPSELEGAVSGDGTNARAPRIFKGP